MQTLEAFIPKLQKFAAHTYAKEVEEITKEWKQASYKVTPLDTGNLRDSLATQVSGSTRQVRGTISGNAYNKGFNYGYYIHERDAGGRKLRYPGTVKRFLAEPLDTYERRWIAKFSAAVARDWAVL